ncbi:aminotransferase class III-fold pyridoxal phosphate-dependent enzyme [Hymenobacter radiodurans]|uniref:aminotransferase class III-fold pyridoxal phosphate-dependent enzyme n=1 Tax=Hymenobacter radiodurans TaxID=2496028 RepID=UPI00293931B7|nr:aminotransferase class III-fold pyridoxal phosphate-dependent enzyme [Hymenobacter radiodurans]
MLFDVAFIDVPVPGREVEALAQLEAVAAQGDVAAFIFEPLLLGTAGMLTYSAEALDELLGSCHRHGILAIADEVMTGFGRTGQLFACDYLAERPDMVCLSKGLTGGTMALGVTSCAGPVYDAFLSDDKLKTFFHGHSYTANPVACAAGLASLELLRDPACAANIARMATAHQVFQAEITGQPGVRDVRLLGTVLAVEFEEAATTSYFSSLRDELYELALQRRVILRPLGNIIYLMPPYCTTDAELSLLYDTVRAMRELVVGRNQ